MMQKRRTHLYTPGSKEPFNVSRSKIALFMECPQCFWLDRRLGIVRPDMFPFNLNNAVDALLKKEFDALREKKEPHRLMNFYRIHAIPFWHENLHLWRDDQRKVGASTLHRETNFNVHGMIDDIWLNTATGDLHIVDYKATSSDYPISLDSKYRDGYKRQMEVYQWIFRRLGFPISGVGYFLFANASKNREGFYNKLEFESSILPYDGDSSWIDPTLKEIKNCLESDALPEPGPACQYCAYRMLINREVVKNQATLI